MAKKTTTSRKARERRQSRFALVGAAAFAFAASVGVGLYFVGAFDNIAESPEAERAQAKAANQLALQTPHFHTFPEMVVDLRTAHCRAPFLRFTLVVQLNGEDQPLIDAYEVRLTDRIQNHIRGYERRELVGVEGANRIRSDMVSVINEVIGPDRAQAALFNNFILH